MEADFPKTAPEEWEVPHTSFLGYKRYMLGQPVPEQRFSDKQLHKQGYKDWVSYCIEAGMSFY